MSYTQIPGKFEEIVAEHETKKEEIQALTKFFSAYKKIIENFSAQLTKLNANHRIVGRTEDSQNSLSKGLFGLLELIRSLSESNMILAKNIQIDVIEPLELFFENFNAVHLHIKEQGIAVTRPLKLGQNKILKLRADYYMASGEAEKAARLAVTEDLNNKGEISDRNEIKLLNKSEMHLAKYLEGLTEVNRSWEEFERKIPSVMENLQQNEESRIHFTKNTLDKFVRYHQKGENQKSNSYKSLLETVSEINPSLDIKLFVSQFHSTGLKKPDEFVNYDDWKKNLNENEYEIVEKDPDIPTAIEYLLASNLSRCNSNTFNELKELITITEGQKIFIECLEASKYSNLHKENLNLLSTFIIIILDLLIQKNEYNGFIFCKIIELSTKFYTKDEYKKTLSWYLTSHPFWKNEKRWTQGINYAINSKIAVVKETQKSRMQKSWEGLMGIEKSEKIESISVYILLSQFGYQLAKLNAPLNLGYNIITTICNDYEIDKDKQALLRIELFSRADYEGVKSKKNKKSLKDLQYIIYKAGKFLSFNEIVQISCVCKDFYSALKEIKYKAVWIECKERLKIQKNLRKMLWVNILNACQVDVDYFAQLELVNRSNSLGTEIEHIIDIDVARSYQKSNLINPNQLKNILRVFASTHPNIGYCQGMNYIAGTLFIVIQDEDLAFKAMASLIKVFKMTSLFNEKLKKLKKLFFIFDRLICKFFPVLNETFKDAWIFSDNYSSGWFIAIFGNIFINRIDVLVQIWDLFLLQGWKGVFKVSLNIIKHYQKSLIDQSYETILSELSSVSQSDIFTDAFFTEAARLPVTSSLLAEFKAQYKKIV